MAAPSAMTRAACRDLRPRAPSSKNSQPWRFHVLTDRAVLDELADAISNSADVETYVPHDPRAGAPYPQYRSRVLESAQVIRDAPATICVENLGAFSAGRRILVDVPREALAGSLAGLWLRASWDRSRRREDVGCGNALGLAVSFMGDVMIAESVIAARRGFQGDLLGVMPLGYSDARPRRPVDVRSFADSTRTIWHDDTRPRRHCRCAAEQCHALRGRRD